MSGDRIKRTTNTKKKGCVSEDSILKREENADMLDKMMEKAIKDSEKQKDKAQPIEKSREDRTLDYLNAIYQNARVGMQSIKDIITKIDNESLIEECNREYVDYGSIALRCEHFASRQGLNIKDNNMFEKVRMWGSIKMSTMINNTTRHIAELLIIGTVMGLNSCYKDAQTYKNLNYELNDILADLEIVQEKNYTKLKEFLKTHAEP